MFLFFFFSEWIGSFFWLCSPNPGLRDPQPIPLSLVYEVITSYCPENWPERPIQSLNIEDCLANTSPCQLGVLNCMMLVHPQHKHRKYHVWSYKQKSATIFLILRILWGNSICFSKLLAVVQWQNSVQSQDKPSKHSLLGKGFYLIIH